VGVFEASSSPLKERYARTDTNVFQLYQPRTFAHLRTEALRNGARTLLARAVKAEVTALSRNASKQKERPLRYHKRPSLGRKRPRRAAIAGWVGVATAYP
jgi:hypothetical protein